MRNDNALLATMAMATKREKESPNDSSGLEILRHPSLSAVDGASIEGEGEFKKCFISWVEAIREAADGEVIAILH